jgi:hypothetical protein
MLVHAGRKPERPQAGGRGREIARQVEVVRIEWGKRNCWALFSMVPQLGVGGWTPRPTNERLASAISGGVSRPGDWPRK